MLSTWDFAVHLSQRNATEFAKQNWLYFRSVSKYTWRERLKKKFETTISNSFLVLFKIDQGLWSGVALVGADPAFAMVWTQLDESRATCTQRSGAGPMWPVTFGKKETLSPALHSWQSMYTGMKWQCHIFQENHLSQVAESENKSSRIFFIFISWVNELKNKLFTEFL